MHREKDISYDRYFYINIVLLEKGFILQSSERVFPINCEKTRIS